jgi:hypothetical protein
MTPLPAMRRGLRLHPDDPDDPRLFRAELPEFGMSLRVAFSEATEDARPSGRLLIDLTSFSKKPGIRNPRRWVTGAAIAGGAILATRRARGS